MHKNHFPLDAPMFSLKGIMTDVRVVRIIDGDTFVFVMHLYDQFFRFTGRLQGINAPEMRPRNTQSLDEKHNIIERAVSAKGFLAQLVTGTNVEVENVDAYLRTHHVVVRVHIHGTDNFGRHLITVFKDGHDLNAEMVHTGHAVDFMVDRS